MGPLNQYARWIGSVLQAVTKQPTVVFDALRGALGMTQERGKCLRVGRALAAASAEQIAKNLGGMVGALRITSQCTRLCQLHLTGAPSLQPAFQRGIDERDERFAVFGLHGTLFETQDQRHQLAL